MPKIAALLVEAAVAIPPAPVVSIRSNGVALVYGRDELAIEAARRLGEKLDCTVLLGKPASVSPPRIADVPIFKGTIVRASGHIGAFEIVVDDYAPALPASRGQLGFEQAQDGAACACDLILDLSGGAPLFHAPGARDGYFRPDPKDAAAVERAIFEIAGLVGEFEKPKYVAYEPEICAHGRNSKTGCVRCLDVCAVGAVAPMGDYVAFDDHICTGCGSCANVCPTGAVAFVAPSAEALLDRLGTLLTAYARAGGTNPILLVHDSSHGEEMIDMIARHGRGLPANVLPFAVGEVGQIGFDFLANAFAGGASLVRIVVDPDKRDEIAGLAGQIGLAEATLAGLGFGEGRVATIDSGDPEAVEAELYGTRPPPPAAGAGHSAAGMRRAATLRALRRLHAAAPNRPSVLPLATGAPFGSVAIDPERCTMCGACAPACPTKALRTEVAGTELHLVEEDCVQCGLCRAICPENAVDLVPRIDFTDTARGPRLAIAKAPA
jgi:ferredoxin